jgi:predicted membrane-bound mannosyltransferase
MIYAAALLAGLAASWLMERKRRTTCIVLLAGLCHLGWQAADAAFLRPADPKNPWVYAQTSFDVYRLRDGLERYVEAASKRRDLSIGIYTQQNLWPLPWYLRDFPAVRWSRTVPSQGSPPPLILATPEMEAALQKQIYESPPPGERELYMKLFSDPLQLRPGVEVRGYVRKSLWDEVQ